MAIDFTDKNLLFAIVTLKNGFVENDQFVEILNKWSIDKSNDVADLFLKNGMLDEFDVQAIDALVQRQIRKHAGADKPSMRIEPDEADLSAIADSDVRSQLEEFSLIDSASESSQSAIEETQASGIGLSPSIIDRLLEISNSSAALSTEELRDDSDGEGWLSNRTMIGARDQTRYKILRPHAKGGLGEVRIALDTELGREVALKEIRSNYVANEQLRQRFEMEAFITGGLEHPGIVPVYGFGRNKSGEPFLAMRFIHGETLKEATLEYHDEENTSGQKRMQFRNLLARFVDCCNAVAYAHSRGVIHRDIKPANVMLGKFGETLVVDWGLAKRIGRDEHYREGDEATLVIKSGINPDSTLDGSAVGTPAFMSPEQAAGKVEELTAASDVYNLGATLYYVLTGKTAYEGDSAAAVLAKVCANDYLPPIKLNRQVPRELNAICCKAMSLEPDDRYQTATDLAVDIENWMADESVAAYDEPFWSKAGRWLRNHKTFSASSLVLIVTALLASVVGMLLIGTEKTKTEQALAILETEKREKEDAMDAASSARSLLKDVTDEVVDYLFVRQVAVETSDEEYFDDIINEIERTTESHGESIEAKKNQAEVYQFSGNMRFRLNQLEPAMQAYGKSEEILRSLLELENRAEYVLSLAYLLSKKAILLKRLKLQSSIQAAIANETEAITLLNQLVQDNQNPIVCNKKLAALYTNRGNTHLRSHDPISAEKDFLTASGLYKNLISSSNSPELIYESAVNLNNLSKVYSQQLAKSEATYRDVLEILNLLPKDSTNRKFRAQKGRTRNNLGLTLLKLSKKESAYQKRQDLRAGARIHFEDAITTFTGLSNEYPSIPEYQKDLADALVGLGKSRTTGGKQSLRDAELILSKLVSEYPNEASFKLNLAVALDALASRDPGSALSNYEKAVELRTTLLKLDPGNRGYFRLVNGSLLNLANYLRKQKDFEDELDVLIKAQDLLEEFDNPATEIEVRTLQPLAVSLERQERYDEALEHWTRLAEFKEEENWNVFELKKAIGTIRSGGITDGLVMADSVYNSYKDNGSVAFATACCYAVAAEMEEKPDQQNFYSERAMSFLYKAEALGFFDGRPKESIMSEKNLRSLREIEKFKEFANADSQID